MGVRDRLEAKQRRRAVVPIEVCAQTLDQETRAAALMAQRLTALARGDSEAAADFEAQSEELASETRVEVAFTALEPSTFEKVVAQFPSPEGGMDRDAALPVLAALCADDEELQDDEWWAGQVTSGLWAYGELTTLWQTLLALNSNSPPAYVPKG